METSHGNKKLVFCLCISVAFYWSVTIVLVMTIAAGAGWPLMVAESALHFFPAP